MEDPSPAAAAARLARLELDPAEVRELGGHLERILDAFRALAEVDVDGVEPLFGPAELLDVLREDRARAEPGDGARDALLAAAPEREGDFFRVPKTVGGAG